MDLHSGQVIADRYRLEECLGAGSGGVVWRATDLKLRRTVALKFGARMPAEGTYLAQLAHPNVIAVFDVIGEDVLITEYLDARSLAKVREQDGPLAPRDAARTGRQIAAALAHLHEKSIVHRDISPGNILLTKDLVAKLTDFGISTWSTPTLDEDPKIGGGTDGFMAPEVVGGNHAGPPADLYSLGATLSRAIEGHPGDRVSAALAELLSELLRTEPADRPTASETERRLRELTEPRSTRRLVIAGVSLVVAVALVVWFTHGPPSGSPVSAKPANPVKPASLMGDPHTADPCALTYANALTQYGEVTSSDDYGNFNRCDALVYLTPNHDDYVDVRVQFGSGQPDPSTPVQQVGAIGIQRMPEQDGDCERLLQLPGQYEVDVDAAETGNEAVDLCGMADAITSGALVALNGGTIARRQLPAASLASRNACALADTSAATGALGPGDVVRTEGFAGWECEWNQQQGPGRVMVVFDRDPTGDEDGTALRLGHHSAFVLPQGRTDTDCLVSVVYRGYSDAAHQPTDDVVEVDVDEDGTRAPSWLCAPARKLATEVEQRLPR